MKKRIFIGFKLSENLVSYITNWQKQKKFPDFVRFVSPNNLHMTLIPPWYEDEIKRIVLLLSNFLDEQIFYNFEVDFVSIKSAPDKKNPRILWLEGKIIVQLENFRNTLIEKLNLKKERRNLIPHITLARFGKGRSLLHFEEPVFFKEKLKEIVIFESKLSKNGASYRVLEIFKL